jgi:hypothetical protein
MNARHLTSAEAARRSIERGLHDPSAFRAALMGVPVGERDAWVDLVLVFVDVGAGPGRAMAFVHLLTGAGAVGLEIQPELVHAVHALTASLGLSRVRCTEGDAAAVAPFMVIGSVFFFNCRSAVRASRRCSTTSNPSRERGSSASAASTSRSRRGPGSRVSLGGAESSRSIGAR